MLPLTHLPATMRCILAIVPRSVPMACFPGLCVNVTHVVLCAPYHLRAHHTPRTCATSSALASQPYEVCEGTSRRLLLPLPQRQGIQSACRRTTPLVVERLPALAPHAHALVMVPGQHLHSYPLQCRHHPSSLRRVCYPQKRQPPSRPQVPASASLLAALPPPARSSARARSARPTVCGMRRWRLGRNVARVE